MILYTLEIGLTFAGVCAWSERICVVSPVCVCVCVCVCLCLCVCVLHCLRIRIFAHKHARTQGGSDRMCSLTIECVLLL